jgi:hypothetical protein
MSAKSANHRNPTATASCVTAIVLLGAPLGVLAIVLGAIGLYRSSKLDGKGAPVALIGVVGGIVAPVGSLAWLFSPGCSLPGC